MASKTRTEDLNGTDDGDGTQDGQGTEANVPEDPTQLSRHSWLAVLKRTIREFQADKLTDWAAALTYYGVLAIFPALLAVVSVLGLIGHSATAPLLENLDKVAPGPAEDILRGAIKSLQSSQSGSGVALVIGLGGALWSASAYVGAFMRASNTIYDIGEGRPIWKTLTTRVLITIVLLAMVILVGAGVTVTAGLATQVGHVLGIGSTAVTVWDIVKWPVILIIVMLMFAILYWAAPNVKQPNFVWASPGSIVGVLLWIVASAVFALYVSNFSSYNKTYGALGGVIVFLVWLWVSNIAILLGAEFNAEIERGRQMQAGLTKDNEPFLEARDARKLKD